MVESQEPATESRAAPPAKRRGDLAGGLIITALAAVAALPVIPWFLVAAWAAVVLSAIWVEARQVSRGWLVAVVSALTNTLYASAALGLIIWGDPAARMFSFALMAVCMVHVLMRHLAHLGPLLGRPVLGRPPGRAHGREVRGHRRDRHAQGPQARRRSARLRRPRRDGEHRPAGDAARSQGLGFRRRSARSPSPCSVGKGLTPSPATQGRPRSPPPGRVGARPGARRAPG